MGSNIGGVDFGFGVGVGADKVLLLSLINRFYNNICTQNLINVVQVSSFLII
jgi:hypothetical protein